MSLTDREQMLLDRFCVEVEGIQSQHVPATLCQKFLMARKWDSERAKLLCQQHFERYKKLGLVDIDPTEQDVQEQLMSGKYVVPGTRDKTQAEIMIVRAELHKPSNVHLHANLKAIVFLLTCLTDDIRTQRNGVTILYDLTAVTWSNMDYALNKGLLTLLHNAFPGRLHAAYILNAPKWFKYTTKMAATFMSAKELSKIQYLSNLFSVFDGKAIPDFLGGLCKYDHESAVTNLIQKHHQSQQGDQTKKWKYNPYFVKENSIEDVAPSIKREKSLKKKKSRRYRRLIAEAADSADNTDDPSDQHKPLNARQKVVPPKTRYRRLNDSTSTETQAPSVVVPMVDEEIMPHEVVVNSDTSTDDDDDENDLNREETEEERKLRERFEAEISAVFQQSDVVVNSDSSDTDEEEQIDNPLDDSGDFGKEEIIVNTDSSDDSDEEAPPVPRRKNIFTERHNGYTRQKDDNDAWRSILGAVTGEEKGESDFHLPITKSDFHSHLDDLQTKGSLINHFVRLQQEEYPDDFKAARLEVNREKNRYPDVLPYDKTRVIIPATPSRSDYINADYVCTKEGQCPYIASQGPKENTVDDFWTMVWTHNTKIIVMAARLIENDRSKCARYWPSQVGAAGAKTFSRYKVTLVSQKDDNGFVNRELELENLSTGNCKPIIHYQFVAWPDFGVPESTDSVLALLADVNEQMDDGSGPIVVHCSAGIGRTGTLLTVDLALKDLKDKGKTDLYEIVRYLRCQRWGMVQTPQQYEFCYKTVEDAIAKGLV